jgi:arylsulfatase A-like enzyme
MTRRQWLVAAAGAAAAPAQARGPNIVLIVADDLGYGDLGCYGNQEIRTPHIDGLAREGVKFSSFVVSWPACTPSRGSILTGRYPQRNGLYDMIRNDEVNWKFQFDEESYAVSEEMTLGLDLREVTISQALKKAGYATGIVGKWDSGRAKRFLPLQRGFDFFYGFANTGIDYYTHERYGIASMFRGNDRIKEEGHATDLFEREALGFIRANRAQPFFLYAAFNAPHGASTFDRAARQSPERYLQMYAGQPRAAYKALVTHLDDAVGAILRELRESGLADNTLVVFTSDNGGTGAANNGGLRGAKAQLWEGGVRVPFLARWPGRIPAGSENPDLAGALELFPTFLAAAGSKPPPGVQLDGFDLLPALEGRKRLPRSEMYWQRRGARAARVGRWKWVDGPEGRGLFDLESDVGEKRDLTAEKPEKAREMRERWLAWRREMDASQPRGPFRDY